MKEMLKENKNTERESQAEKVDVIVVGAGMAGLLIGYYLQREGKKVLILEAKEVASGQTWRTTAKITSQHGLKYAKLINDVGVKKARLYARANEDAVREYENLIKQENIDCDFERAHSYLYTISQPQLLEKEARAVQYLDIDGLVVEKTRLPFKISKALCFTNQAEFSPLKFIDALKGKLKIMENTKVTKIKGQKVYAGDRVFIAKDIVVATHYPIKNVPGFYFLRQHQERSYVMALSGGEMVKGMYYGIDKEGFSLRQEGEWTLIGGGGHRTGKNKKETGYDFLRKIAKEYFSGYKEEAWWSAQDCIPHDGIPFIGKYSLLTPHLYVATGFQKWGMTTSMVAAMIISDMICGRENPYVKVFTPQRINFKAAIGNFIVDAGQSTAGLIKGLLGRPRCPHMGCKLVWNPNEKTWDCPCHGSRFSEDGDVIDNPAINSIK